MTGKVIESAFRPDPLVRGPHGQTVVAALLRKAPSIPWRWERIELPDGDFVDLAWHGPPPGGGPMVLLLHGLAGSPSSPYIRDHAAALADAGIPVVAMCFRGCSGEPNRLPRGYHSGETADLVTSSGPETAPGCLSGGGFSLGETSCSVLGSRATMRT